MSTRRHGTRSAVGVDCSAKTGRHCAACVGPVAAVSIIFAFWGVAATSLPALPTAADRHAAVCCYPPNLTPEQWDAIVEHNGALPPTLLTPPGQRFFTDSAVWTGDISIGPSMRAQPAHLTYSFPSDGATWGLPEISETGANNLNATFVNRFGAGNVDRGRELVRQSIAAWRRIAALSYDEVADDNTLMAQDQVRVPTRGDIRIGGRMLGEGTFLAYNAFPTPVFAGVGGGDMCVNTSYFEAGFFANSANNYRFFRNTMAHEHGHGLGNIHVIPCNHTKLMEPVISSDFDMLSIDEIRGAQRSYGDRFAGNQSAATAKDFGDLSTPVVRSIIERDLSTNGATGFGNTGEDWFRFSIQSPLNVAITITPTGGRYQNGPQEAGCTPTTAPQIVASDAGSLALELRDESGTTVIDATIPPGPGLPQSLSEVPLSPGTYTVRVVDIGPNAQQFVQTYDLTIRVGTSLAPPRAIAGLNKRCQGNTNCFFYGDVNSSPAEIGATLPSPNAFDWDLDGDGVFETLDNPQPMRRYVSNGEYPATLRVTDSNGQSATDTILVRVWGSVTTVSSVTPRIGAVGQTVPITIVGTNFKNVVSTFEIGVSGSGISVVGAPVSNPAGTVLTGLLFVISPTAPLGPRNVAVANADGGGVGIGVFTVVPTPMMLPGDVDCDGTVTPADAPVLALALVDPLTYATLYAGCPIENADVDGNGRRDGNDVQAFANLMP